MGAKRPRRRQQPVTAARTGAPRPAHRQFLPERLVGVARRNTDWVRPGPVSWLARGRGSVLSRRRPPSRAGRAQWHRGRRLACLQLRGQRRCCTGFPFQSDRSDHPGRFQRMGAHPTQACRTASTTPESRTCRQRIPGILKKTPRLRRRETGRQGETGPLRVRLRQDRISVDGVNARGGLFRGAAAQWPAAWRARRARKPST